jgi:hypothetical protein
MLHGCLPVMYACHILRALRRLMPNKGVRPSHYGRCTLPEKVTVTLVPELINGMIRREITENAR